MEKSIIIAILFIMSIGCFFLGRASYCDKGINITSIDRNINRRWVKLPIDGLKLNDSAKYYISLINEEEYITQEILKVVHESKIKKEEIGE